MELPGEFVGVAALDQGPWTPPAHPEDVTRAHLERFQEWLFHYRKDDENPLDFGTQQLHIGAIELFFKWLVERGTSRSARPPTWSTRIRACRSGRAR